MPTKTAAHLTPIKPKKEKAPPKPKPYTVRFLVNLDPNSDPFGGYDDFDEYLNSYPKNVRTVIVAIAPDAADAAYRALAAFRGQWPKDKLGHMFVENSASHEVLYLP